MSRPATSVHAMSCHAHYVGAVSPCHDTTDCRRYNCSFLHSKETVAALPDFLCGVQHHPSSRIRSITHAYAFVSVEVCRGFAGRSALTYNSCHSPQNAFVMSRHVMPCHVSSCHVSSQLYRFEICRGLAGLSFAFQLPAFSFCSGLQRLSWFSVD